MRSLMVCLLLLTASGFAGEAAVTFTGEVLRGEDFRQDIPGGLVFTLKFIGYGPEGWSIRILDPAYPSDNFCSVVTPPYHGINALQIYAWHFFNEDMTGANDGSVNAPGEERRFFFVTDKETFDMAFELLSTMLWPEDPADAEEAAVAHDQISREQGILTITDVETGSIPEMDSVWIDRMEFRVELFTH
jgi:hypothetical protein